MLTHRECWLREAIVEYPLRTQNNTVTVDPMPISQNRTVERILRSQEGEGMSSKYSRVMHDCLQHAKCHMQRHAIYPRRLLACFTHSIQHQGDHSVSVDTSDIAVML